MIKKIFTLIIAFQISLIILPQSSLALYSSSQNEIKIASSLLESGISSYEKEFFPDAIASFAQVLLMDPDNGDAKYYLRLIGQKGNIRAKEKLTLQQLSALYKNIESLIVKINYFENLRNIIGKKIVKKGYSSSDLAEQMIKIKNKAIKNQKLINNRTQKTFYDESTNPLEVLTEYLKVEKEQLVLKLFYIKAQCSFIRDLKNSHNTRRKSTSTKANKLFYNNRFYKNDGERKFHRRASRNKNIFIESLNKQKNSTKIYKKHLGLIQKEIHIFKKEIKEKDQKIKKLTGEFIDSSLALSEKERQLLQKESELERQDEKLIDLISRIQLSNRIIEKKNNEIQKLQSSFQMLENEALFFEKNLNKLVSLKEEEVQFLLSSIEKYKNNLHLAHKYNKENSKEISKYHLQLTKLQEELQKVNTLYEIKNTENLKQNQELQNVYLKLDKYKQQMKLEKRIHRQNGYKIDKYINKASALKEKLKKNKKKLIQKDKKIGYFKKEIRELNIALKHEESSKSSDNKIKALTEDLEILKSNNFEKINKINKINEEKISNLKDAIKELKNNLEEKKRFKEVAKTELNEYKMKLKTKKNSDFKKELNLKSLKNKYKKLQLKNNDIINERSALEGDLVKRNAKLKKLKEKINQLSDKLSGTKDIIKKNNDKISLLNKQLIRLKTNLKENELLINDQNFEISSFKEILKEAQIAIKSTKTKNGLKIEGVDTYNTDLANNDNEMKQLSQNLSSWKEKFDNTENFHKKETPKIILSDTKLQKNLRGDDVQTEKKKKTSKNDNTIANVLNPNETIEAKNKKIKSEFQSLKEIFEKSQKITDQTDRGEKNNELKGIVEIYKKKLSSTNKALKESNANILILKDQIAFAQKQLFEKEKLFKKTKDH